MKKKKWTAATAMRRAAKKKKKKPLPFSDLCHVAGTSLKDVRDMKKALVAYDTTVAQLIEDKNYLRRERDGLRKDIEENKVALAALFRDVRNTIEREEEFEGRMPLLLRFKTMAMPAFMVRQTTKLTKKRLWQKVTVLLNNFVYDRYHGSLSSVTTVKKSPNTPRRPVCGNGGWCVKPPGHEGKCVPEMCSGYPNYNGCGKPHGHEGMCIPGEPGYIRPKAILPGDCCGNH